MPIKVFYDVPKENHTITVSSDLLMKEPNAAEIVSGLCEEEAKYRIRTRNPSALDLEVSVGLFLDIASMYDPTSTKSPTTINIVYSVSARVYMYEFDNLRDFQIFKLKNHQELEGHTVEYQFNIRFEGVAFCLPSLAHDPMMSAIPVVPESEKQRIESEIQCLFRSCDVVECQFVRSSQLHLKYQIMDAVVSVRTTQWNKLKLHSPSLVQTLSTHSILLGEITFTTAGTKNLLQPYIQR